MDITDRLLNGADMDGREVREEAAAEIRRLRDDLATAQMHMDAADVENYRLREQLRVAREALEWDRALFARFGKGEGSRQNALHAWTRAGDTLTQLETNDDD